MHRLQTFRNEEVMEDSQPNEILPATHHDVGTLRYKAHRTATFKVAASNSSDEEKALADYVCTGQNDEREINCALLTAARGGTVELSKGVYYIGQPIVLSAGGLVLRGQGQHGTLIKANSVPQNEAAIKLTANDCVLKGLGISGPQTVQKPKQPDFGVWSIGARYWLIEDCLIEHFRRYGIYMTDNNWGSTILHCVIRNNWEAQVHSLGTATHQNGNGLRVIATEMSHCPYWPLKLDPATFIPELDAEQLSEALEKTFKDKGKPLTEEATVMVEQVGSKWRIIDAAKLYLIQHNDPALDVYEYFWFLKLDTSFILELDAEQLSETLEKKFKDKGKSLEKATVTVEQAGNKWRIDDKAKVYLIQRNHQALDVYEDSDCYRQTASGLLWSAGGLLVDGCSFQILGNVGIGIGEGAPAKVKPTGFTITGCYFESIKKAAIRIGDNENGDAGKEPDDPEPGEAALGAFIAGNYFSGNFPWEQDMIKLSHLGSGFIGGNSFIRRQFKGRTINSIKVGETCWIIFPEQESHENPSTFDKAHVMGLPHQQFSVSGDIDQVGMDWTPGQPKSNNLAGKKETAYFRLPGLKPNDYIDKVTVCSEGSSSDTVSVSAEKLETAKSGATWSAVDQPETFTGPGDHDHNIRYRVEDGYAVRLRIEVNANANSGSSYLYNPRIEMSKW